MSTGRVYLGIALMFYGFCCVLIPIKKRYSVIKGLLIMALSIYFHKSMVIYICAAILSLVYYKKWMLTVALCAIPILIKIFLSLLISYLGSGEAVHSVFVYLEADQIAQGPGILIYLRLLYLLMFAIFIISSIYVVKYLNLPLNTFRRIWQMAFILICLYIVVFCALTLNGIGSTSISGRITLGLYFPLAIILSKMLRDKFKTKLNLSLLFLFYIIGVYRLMYAYYIQSLGGGI